MLQTGPGGGGGRPTITQVQVRSGLLSPASSHDSLFGIQRIWFMQLSLLAINLVCCGGIVGLSRLLPELGATIFQQHSYQAVLFIIVTFGLFKAVFNLLVGTLANAAGRKILLLIGWCVSFITPSLIWIALSWSLSWTWIIVATAFLGASQGLCTSTVVIMVLDIIPQQARGVCMGILECTIYVSLGLCTLVANEIYTRFGNFHAVIVVHYLLCGLGLFAAIETKETHALHLQKEGALLHSGNGDGTMSHSESEDESVSLNLGGRRRKDVNYDEENPPTIGDTPQPSLEWASLREDDDTKNLSHGPLASNSILTSLDLHTIPASPQGSLHSDAHTNGSLPHMDLSTQLVAPIPRSLPMPQRKLSHHSPTMSKSSSREDLLPTHRHSSTPPIQAAATIGSTSSTSSFMVTFRQSLSRVFSSSVLRAIVQAGFFNNFKDGVAWGCLPAFFSIVHKVTDSELGYLLTIYPLVWGLGQLVTGRLSDRYGRVKFIILGLSLQAFGLLGLILTPTVTVWLTHGLFINFGLGLDESAQMSVRFAIWLFLLFLVGLGTACSYPVLQAYIGDYVSPLHRASTIGVYRLCRDLGYAFGGLLSGLVADLYGIESALIMISLMLLISSGWAMISLPPDGHHSDAAAATTIVTHTKEAAQ